MNDNPMQRPQTTPTISRLDYIATAIYAAWSSRTFVPRHEAIRLAIAEAKAIIVELDKETT